MSWTGPEGQTGPRGFSGTSLAAVMIVKNEEKLLRRCLESLKGIDEIIILDTGSTDGTEATTLGIPNVTYLANVYKWNDSFSEARNKALKYASAQWCLTIDADEFIQPGDVDRIRRHLEKAQPATMAYRVVCEAEGGAQHSTQPRIHRNSHAVKWSRNGHNSLNVDNNEVIPGVKVTYGRSPNHDKDPDRTLRLLEKDLAESQTNTRTLFYLAREYVYKRQWEKAVELFDRYLARATWAPEKSEAYLLKAKSLWQLHRGDEARVSCLFAIGLNPEFAEALRQMAIMSWPAQAKAWERYARSAKNEGVIFVRHGKEKGADYYDQIWRQRPHLGRYEQIYRKAAEWTAGRTTLDIACGTAELARYVTNYTGFDFSAEAIKIARENGKNAREGDLYDENSYKGDFDVFTALEVLEHVDDRALLEQIPTGKTIIFSVPSFEDPGHVRTYTEDTIRERLQDMIDIDAVIRFDMDEGTWKESRAHGRDFILLCRATRKTRDLTAEKQTDSMKPSTQGERKDGTA